jgi:malate synthase
VELSNGHRVTRQLVESMIDAEMAAIRDRLGEDAFSQGRWDDARATFTQMALADEYPDFLTLPAYERMP